MSAERQTELPSSTIIRRSDEQVSVDLDGETVLLHTETGGYFTMNEVASEIWGMLSEPLTIDGLIAKVEDTFEPPEEGDQRAELHQFINRLTTIGVLETA